MSEQAKGRVMALHVGGRRYPASAVLVSTPTIPDGANWVRQHLDHPQPVVECDFHVTAWHEEAFRELMEQHPLQITSRHRLRNHPTQTNPTNPRKKR